MPGSTLPAGLRLGTITEQERVAWVTAGAFQFGARATEEQVARNRDVTDPARALAVWDGDRIVATTYVHADQLALPGGRMVPVAGVASVGVRTTHRRRGLLTALMGRVLDDATEAGITFAALYASEAPIYGRYGYGPAAHYLRLEVATRDLVLRDPVDALARRVELLDPAEAERRCPQIFRAASAERPGMITRSAAAWDQAVRRPHADGDGASRRVAALGHRAYALFTTIPAWTDDRPAGRLEVTELVAVDPETEAAMWAFLASTDLMTTITAENRPADEPLQLTMADPASARLGVSHALHLRLVDVPAALELRRYDHDSRLVLEVADPALPANTGRWVLQAGPDGASCTPTDEPWDLSLEVGMLGAAYLGGTSFARLAAARRIAAARPEALRTADRLFAVDRAPWNPHLF